MVAKEMVIKMSLLNDAMHNTSEIARILKKLANEIENDNNASEFLSDINGNTIGKVYFK